MDKIKLLSALALAVTLTGALPGCATYEKCGLEGCPGDAKITANVQARLNQDTDLGPPDSITVQTLNSVVYLNGLVDVGFEKRMAETAARGVPGVTKVVNNISVSH